ncbi:hypothetical protein ACFLX5_03225 [Chloroflexota bacterium]
MGQWLDMAKSLRDCVKSEISAKSPPFSPRGNCLKYSGDQATKLELDEIVTRVEEKGYVLLWSTVLQDLVAFYKTDADLGRIPPGFVPYSDQELWELFG